ncbi:class I SAM-dependent methyltransferase [Streptomyces sp. NPDC002082]|uniref:class I SAM-dependent methyltransferase n=1 Tax=Streptomyces sp. NPDC002082 TaxID=3154772 RepID=UPI0033344E2C
MTDPSTLFASTAWFYARYRPWYPEGFFDLLTSRFALDGTQTVLDLGCGPGMVALPLADRVAQVYAVDPEPGMLAEGTRLARERHAPNIQWRRGDSTTITRMDLPPQDLCVMAKAFHWMNRPQVLADLDQLITEHGGVVVASAGPPGTTTLPNWADVIADVRTAYLGPARRAGNGFYPKPVDSFRETLEHSPFPYVCVTAFEQHVSRTVDELVGIQFSNSYSTTAQLGDRKDAFEADLRRALAEHSPDGLFHEQIHTEALIATRRPAKETPA